jgi:DNA-binding NtrC family response regulator
VLDRPEVVIGRDASCDIVIDDTAASRRHARISHRDGLFAIADLGSRNGTRVDGDLVYEAALEPLHEIRVGDTFFKFVARDAERHARYRIDGAIDGAIPGEPRALVGGLAVRRHDEELARVAPTSLACAILGETGTGKELVARELHRLSGRTGRFHAINCASIPRELFESELFGYRKGAFSGAHKDRVGLVQAAHGGTLFLDEVGDMPIEGQAKLLRVLQTHEVLPVGAVRPERVDLRVVCATHYDLYRLVQRGAFRGDLFARLSEYVTTLLPLRERKEDLYALTLAFVARHAQRRLEPSVAFMAALIQYDWPFNVRELESAIKRAAVLAEGGVLEPKHLPPAVLEESTGSDRAEGPRAPRPSQPASSVSQGPARSKRADPNENEGPARSKRADPNENEGPAREELRAAPSERASAPPRGAESAALRAAGDGSPDSAGFLRGAPTEGKMRELLQRHGGNVAAVARELGKGRMQVHRWVRKYHLSIDDYRARP